MKNKNLLAGFVVSLWTGVALICLPVMSVLATEDVLERPAMPSSRLDERVLLALSQAGPRLVAVGEHGLVLLSDDHGKSWRQAQVPVSVTLTNVYFVNDRQGWAVGHSGVVLHSSDAGETWLKQLDGKAAAQSILAAARTLMPADPGRVAEAERLVAEGPDKPFLDVRFHDGEHGLVVGAYGLAFSTDDGGRHWTPRLNIPNPRGLHLYRIALAGERVYIAGEQGALFYSRDGGENFSVLPSPYEGSYFGLLAAPDGLLLVFGLRGNLFRSDDAGQSWQAIDSGGSVALADGLYAGDGSLVLVDQAGRVLRSRDRGRTFQSRLIASAGPVASVVESGDGSLLLGGLHGITRVPLASNSAGGAQ